MRRTLIVTNDFPPRPGGIQSFVHGLATRLPADTVVVYAPAWEGAAAPNRTVSQPCSRAMAAARRDTDGTGSMSDVGCRITGNGCRASNSAAPSQAGAYTITVSGGSLVASPCTND